jgi:hypothetical protein
MIAELSDDYRLVLPLVFSCGAAALVSRSLERTSLFRLGPSRRASGRSPPAALLPLRAARSVSDLECAQELLADVLTPDPRPLFAVDERGRLRGTFHPETARKRLAAERLPRLLIVDDLVDRDGPRLALRASRDEARAIFAAPAAPRFVPVVDDDGVLIGELCREDFVS